MTSPPTPNTCLGFVSHKVHGWIHFMWKYVLTQFEIRLPQRFLFLPHHKKPSIYNIRYITETNAICFEMAFYTIVECARKMLQCIAMCSCEEFHHAFLQKATPFHFHTPRYPFYTNTPFATEHAQSSLHCFVKKRGVVCGGCISEKLRFPPSTVY